MIRTIPLRYLASDQADCPEYADGGSTYCFPPSFQFIEVNPSVLSSVLSSVQSAGTTAGAAIAAATAAAIAAERIDAVTAARAAIGAAV